MGLNCKAHPKCLEIVDWFGCILPLGRGKGGGDGKVGRDGKGGGDGRGIQSQHMHIISPFFK